MGAKKDAMESSSRLLTQQFEFQKALLQKREGQRDSAIGAMNNLIGNMPQYKIPVATQQYVKLMNALGGELSQLRDPSNASTTNLAQYAAQPEGYDVLKMPGVEIGGGINTRDGDVPEMGNRPSPEDVPPSNPRQPSDAPTVNNGTNNVPGRRAPSDTSSSTGAATRTTTAKPIGLRTNVSTTPSSTGKKIVRR